MKQNKKCMTATLTGASALVAGAAIAFGAAAAFIAFIAWRGGYN